MRSYFYVLTLQLTRDGTLMVSTSAGEGQWEDGTPRLQILQQLQQVMLAAQGFPPDFQGFSVLFFSLEPAHVGPFSGLD